MSFTRHFVSLSFLFVLFFSSIETFAEDDFSDEMGDEDELADFYGDDDFVSIATGIRQQVAKAPAVATVITAEDIKNMGARNLVEVLDTVPGMHVARNGQEMAPRFWLRGIVTTFTPQTLFMVNGVSTKSIVRGDNHVAWGEYPIHSISRIEIIRGPGSALYGADAFSGVINIITKKAIDLRNSEVGATLGSFDTNNVWASKAIDNGDWSFAFNFEYSKSDGYNGIIESDAQTGIDAIGALVFGAPPVSKAPGPISMAFEAIDLWMNIDTESYSFDLGIQDRNDVGMGQGGTEALDLNGRFGSYKHILKAAVKPQEVSKDFKLGAELHYYRSSQEIHENLHLFPEGAFFGAFPDGFVGNPGWQEETMKFEVKGTYAGLEGHTIAFGTGYSLQDLYEVTEAKNFNPDLSPRAGGLADVSDTSEVFMPEADRDNYFIYLQDIYQLAPDWELTAGVRFDDYSDFGSTTNPRLALVWSTSLNLTTKFLYGRAFRAPAFAETLVVNNPVSLGNPNIEPEIIDTFEIALSYRASEELNLDFNFFSYDIKDLISFIPDSGAPTITAQNVGERSGYGMELAAKYKPSSNWSVLANYSYAKAEDDIANDDVGEYPNHQAYVRSNWKLSDAWKMHAQISIIGERERIPGSLRDKMDGYNSVDLGLSYKFEKAGVDLELLARNVFDEDIREPSSDNSDGATPANILNDLPQAGSSLYFRVSKSF